MGVRLDATALSGGGGGTARMLVPALRRFGRKGALALADEAARACLQRAGRTADEVELLINVGVYRDHNLGEPALASLIQEDIGGDARRLSGAGHGTFSFDVAAGGCGVVHAFHLLDRFIRSGTLGLALVVASDADPDPGRTHGFPYAAVGGAALLVPGDGEEGFSAFHFEDFPEFSGLLRSRVCWEAGRLPNPLGWGGRNVLSVEEAPGYAARAAECAAAATNRFLESRDLSLDEIDLLVTSRHPPTLSDALEQYFNLPGDRVAQVSEPFEGSLSAGPIAAVEAARRSGRFSRARRILFVTVGAGIEIALALYEQRVE